jgi:hypothetical protein
VFSLIKQKQLTAAVANCPLAEIVIVVSSIWEFHEFKGRTDLFSKVVTKGAKRRKL